MFYVCNDFERALGLENVLPDFHIICIDYNPAIHAARSAGAKIFCLEEMLDEKNPIFRNSNKLLHRPEVQRYISENSRGETPELMFFKIAPNIEYTCALLGYKILNTTSELNQLFEEKLSQFEQLSGLEYFPETIVAKLEDVTYTGVKSKLGEKFVIQYNRGHTGSGTVFVNAEQDFEQEQKLFPKREARISRFVGGQAWTINACATRMGVAYGGLSYQITGLPECTTKPGGTVGNDWYKASELSQYVIDQIELITTNVGLVMIKAGFKGLFGLDLIVDEYEKVYLIEVNARQPASTGMHTKLMLEQGLIPLELLHISETRYPITAECTDESKTNDAYKQFIKDSLSHAATKYPAISNNLNRYEDISGLTITLQNKQAITPIKASQVIIRNTEANDVESKGELRSGVYNVENPNLPIYIKPGYNVTDIMSVNEVLILATAQRRIISPESEVARIQAKDSLVRSLEETNSIVKAVKSALI